MCPEGGSWLLSALAALADQPELLLRVFLRDATAEGLCLLRLCWNGCWTLVFRHSILHLPLLITVSRQLHT